MPKKYELIRDGLLSDYKYEPYKSCRVCHHRFKCSMSYINRVGVWPDFARVGCRIYDLDEYPKYGLPKKRKNKSENG